MHKKLEKYFLIFQDANEKFDGNLIKDYLAHDVIYTSQHVLEDLVGKEKVLHYLVARYKYFELHKDNQKRTFEKAYATGGSQINEPCLILKVNNKKEAYIFFELNDNDQIQRIITLSIPFHSLKSVKRFRSEK